MQYKMHVQAPWTALFLAAIGLLVVCAQQQSAAESGTTDSEFREMLRQDIRDGCVNDGFSDKSCSCAADTVVRHLTAEELIELSIANRAAEAGETGSLERFLTEGPEFHAQFTVCGFESEAGHRVATVATQRRFL